MNLKDEADVCHCYTPSPLNMLVQSVIPFIYLFLRLNKLSPNFFEVITLTILTTLYNFSSMRICLRNNCYRGEWMVKKAVIVISLLKESNEKSNGEIERDIFKELSRLPAKIPWMKEVEKVTVTEA